MNIFISIMAIISLILFLISFNKLKQAQRIKIDKTEEAQLIQEELDQKRNNLSILQNEISKLQHEKFVLLENAEADKEKVRQEYNKKKAEIAEQIKIYEQNTSYASEQYIYCLEKEYDRVEQEYDRKIAELEESIQRTNNNLQEAKDNLHKMQESLNAGVQAQLREREKAEKINFYKLQINDNDMSDIEALNRIKSVLHQPVVLSKLIWSQYFMKQTSDMCNRVFGTDTVCGIYKITNLTTGQCYIGQSVNVQDRMKQHIKCGLGIDASATNKLYKAMQEDGVWNFTFELMEACSRDQLNEKERFWIQLYQSDKTGYNSTKGNK